MLAAAATRPDAAPVDASPSATAPIWSGESGGVRIEWTANGIFLAAAEGGKVDLFDRSKSEPGCDGEQSDRLLSVVGSLVSYEEFVGTTCEQAAHPSAVTLYVAVDAGHRDKKPSLTDFFADADLVRALSADPLVRRHLPKNPPHTSGAFVKALTESQTECEYAFDPDMLSRFAFHHVEGGQVSVRIGLSHGCELARGKLTQLGILLPVPAKLKDALERASTRAEGFLMRDAQAIGRGKQTSFRF